MTDKEIQRLIDIYLEGKTSPEEEHRLARELLRQDIPEEWQAIRLMLGELAMGEAEYDTIMSQRQKKATVIKMRRRWIAAAATLLLLIGIGTMVWNKDNTTSDKKVAKVEKHSIGSDDIISSESVKTDFTPVANEITTASAEKGTVKENKQQRAATMAPLDTTKEETTETYRSALDEDPNLHYASQNLSKDTLPYQNPARMDEFIAKMADYYKVREGEMKCSAHKDSNIVSTVYVFPDKTTVSTGRQEIDLFNRLLQAACWYSDETPGYLLSFSHQQFFFELKDMRRQLQYRWIAERINGKILLYGTHAPLGTKESSTCYQEYRDELMHIKSINNKPKKI